MINNYTKIHSSDGDALNGLFKVTLIVGIETDCEPRLTKLGLILLFKAIGKARG